MSDAVTTGAAIKAFGTGGLSILLANLLGSPEYFALFVTALVASILSYFYDWVHRHPRTAGLKELSELLKYIFYGLAVMYIVFYVGVNIDNHFDVIDLPKTVWGFIAALSAGSAVSLIEFVAPVIGDFVKAMAQRFSK